MVYTQKQIKLIQERRPDLRFQRIPTLDDLVVDFLKKFDIIVKPTLKKSKNELGNLNYTLSNFEENKNIYFRKDKISEWEQWREWALEHIDFEEFRVRKIQENQSYNKNILEKINSSDVKEEFKYIFDKSRNFSFDKLYIYGLIFLTIFFPLTIMILNMLQDKKNLHASYFFENIEQPLFLYTI